MKRGWGLGIAGILLLAAAVQAAGGDGPRPAPAAKPVAGDLGLWTRPLAPGAVGTKSLAAVKPAARLGSPAEPQPEIDVVDAHWMALTMWGEARSGGEEAMRAVGHVIDNRRRSGAHGDYATETVSEAWQFSAWNANDPNRAAMLNVHLLRPGSREHDMWLAARRLAAEILAGRSSDPTGGALFYHTSHVAPRWSAGESPTAFIGGHLFFRAAR